MRVALVLFLLVGLGAPARAALRPPNELIRLVERCSYMSACPPFEELMKWRALIAPMLVQRLGTSGYTLNFFAERGLKRLGVDAVPHVIAALSDSNSSRRRRLIAILGDIGNARAFAPLAKLLFTVSRYERRYVIEALGKLGDRRAVPILLRMLTSANWQDQSTAVRAFVHLPHKSAVPHLLKLLSNRRLKSNVIEALGVSGDKRAIPPLLEMLKSQSSMRYYYYWQLGRLAEALGRLGAKEAEPLLLKALSHRSSTVQTQAAFALGMLKSRKALPQLQKMQAQTYYRTRIAATVAIVLIGKHPQGLAALHKMVSDYSSSTRSMAIQAIGFLKDRKSLRTLLDRLAVERYAFVRVQLNLALRQITGRNFGESIEQWTMWAKTHNML